MLNETRIGGRLPNKLPDNPMTLASEWYQHALENAEQRNPNAMTLATVDKDEQPSARVVLCKSFVVDPGYIVFYTNYESHKGRSISDNSRVAVVMHWDALGKQIRLEGLAVKSPAEESDEYFATRGWGSQLGAWGSDQSRPVAGREVLVQQIRARAGELGIELGDETDMLAGGKPPMIRRPDHWGGFRIWPTAVELWIEGADRIHDRARWERRLTQDDDGSFSAGRWSATRLQP